MSSDCPEHPLFGWSCTTWGFIAVSCSVVVFGSFNLPIKSKKIQDLNPDPIVFQIYMNLAIFISSWLVLSYSTFHFTAWGILSAFLWVTSSILSLIAIQNVGLSVAQGVWSGSTILVSFMWGALYFKEELNSLGMCICGLILLADGIVGMSFAGRGKVFDTDSTDVTSLVGVDNIPSGDINTKTEEGKKNQLLGLSCAVILGLTNGSMLVPAKLVPSDLQGINFICSFGIGVLITIPIFSLPYFFYQYRKHKILPQFHWPWMTGAGLLAGTLFNIGNWSSIYATLYLGNTLGFPLTQLSLLVGGLWGIFLFKEITGLHRLILFFYSSFVLLGGAIILGVFGKN